MGVDFQARFMVLDRGRWCRGSLRFVWLQRFLSSGAAGTCSIGVMKRVGVLSYGYRCDVEPEVIGERRGILSRINANETRQVSQNDRCRHCDNSTYRFNFDHSLTFASTLLVVVPDGDETDGESLIGTGWPARKNLTSPLPSRGSF